MTPPADTAERLRFLARVAQKEARHLALTDARLFSTPFTVERVGQLEQSPALAEQVDAFVARYARLQDTLGDKLLPILLGALGEKTGAAIDNLDRAERLGLVPSTERWIEMRKLRNQMVHEYVEDPLVLADALATAHAFVPVLIGVADRLCGEMAARGWI